VDLTKKIGSWRCLSLLVAVLLALAGKAAADTLSGRVVRVIDGDTVVLLGAGNVQERIRLAGIDCPERGQDFGTKAKAALAGRVAGETVAVQWDKRDRYKRIVGKVMDEEGDANLSLVRAGLCWWYRKYAHEQTPEDRRLYEAAEDRARREGRGLWRDPHPVPPWEWRRRIR
jgi:endonuclease YncB( thermonuclease family)